jgi:rod shape determining protein RodA
MRILNVLAFILSVLGLSAFSLVFVYSSTAGDNPGAYGLFSPELKKQLVFYCLGLFLFYTFSRIPYKHWLGMALFFYIANILLLIFVWKFGVVRGGARSWINLGFTQFQPSETMKTAWILYLAAWLRYRKSHRHFSGLFPPFLITGLPMFLVLIQPDMGTAVLYLPTLFAILFLSGARKSHLLIIVMLMMFSCIPLWMFGLKDYQKSRVLAMLDPEAHAQTTAYQMKHSLLAIGEGFWIGKGVGEGRVNRLNMLPESHTDFIFSIIAEEMGFLGACLLIALYLILFYACLTLGASTREPFGRHLALGIGTMMISQTLLNLAVALGLFPTTGITLPFVSSGGSSFISCCIMMGIVMSVARHHVPVLSRDDFRDI